MLQIVLLLITGAVVLAGLWAALRTCRAKFEAEAELAYLSGRLLEVQESERRRITSELQEGAGQQLEVVALNLDGLENRLTGSSSQRAEIVLLARRVRGIADDLQHVRRGVQISRLPESETEQRVMDASHHEFEDVAEDVLQRHRRRQHRQKR